MSSPTSLRPAGLRDRLMRNPWVVFLIVACAQVMVVVDVTIVFTALPSMQADLGLSVVERQWVVNAYVLLFAGCLLLGGRLADVVGRRRMFLAGILVFTTASAGNAFITSPALLIASRGVQGLGAALLASAALSIVTVTFPAGPRRATAMAAWGAVGAAGGALGVLAGGALTQFLSWEWVFLVNLPIGAVTLLAALALIRPDVAEAGASRSFDVLGAVTVTAGLVLMVTAIVKVETAGWLGAATVGCAGASACLLIAFAAIERRQPTPLVPPACLRNRMLVCSNVSLMIVWGTSAGVFFLMSAYIQQVLGWAPLKAGTAFIPYFACVVAVAAISERLAPRIGLRPLILAGVFVSAVAVALLAGVGPHSTYAYDLAPGIALMGVGNAFFVGPMTLVANNSLRDADAGLGSGLYNTSTQIGTSLAIAAFSALAEHAARGAGDPAVALSDGIAAAFTAGAVVVLLAGLASALAFRKRDLAHMTSGAPALLAG